MNESCCCRCVSRAERSAPGTWGQADCAPTRRNPIRAVTGSIALQAERRGGATSGANTCFNAYPGWSTGPHCRSMLVCHIYKRPCRWHALVGKTGVCNLLVLQMPGKWSSEHNYNYVRSVDDLVLDLSDRMRALIQEFTASRWFRDNVGRLLDLLSAKFSHAQLYGRD